MDNTVQWTAAGAPVQVRCSLVPAGTRLLTTRSQVGDQARTSTDNGPVVGVVTQSPVVGRDTIDDVPVPDRAQLIAGFSGMCAAVRRIGRALSSIASTAARAVTAASEIPRAESPGAP